MASIVKRGKTYSVVYYEGEGKKTSAEMGIRTDIFRCKSHEGKN